MFDGDPLVGPGPASASSPQAGEASEPEANEPEPSGPEVEPYAGSGDQNDAEKSLEAGQKDADKNFPATPVDAVSSPCGKQPPSRPPDSPQKTWIEYRLVDDKGKAIPGVRYRVKSPDGSMIDGAFDKRGKARIAALDPGNCKIWLLDVEGKEWKKG